MQTTRIPSDAATRHAQQSAEVHRYAGLQLQQRGNVAADEVGPNDKAEQSLPERQIEKSDCE